MTAEVVVANKLAVSLAADSMISVGRGGFEKTFETVNKVFSLSKFQPVGIMVYGNAEFMGFPWETLIKIYRSKLKEDRFDHIEGYAKDFFRYITTELDFSEEDVATNYGSIVGEKFAKTYKGLEDSDPKSLSLGIQRVYQDLIASEDLNFLTKTKAKDFYNKYVVHLKKFIKDVFIVEKLSRQDLKHLLLIGKVLIQKKDFSSYSSGIVFAGFGDKENFPTVVQYRLDGMFDGSLKICRESFYNAHRKKAGFLQAFAQKEMVQRFMNGIDPFYSDWMRGGVFNLVFINVLKVFEQYCTKTGKAKNKDLELLQSDLKQAFLDFYQQVHNYQEANYSGPIINMIDALPKDDLANLAESLVNLTSIKRRFSEDAVTVGGPIDVAVISKGDGFIWVKRKHYFEASLNQSFRDKYLKT